MLVRQKAFKQKHKIADRWENQIYEVVRRVSHQYPVYEVRAQGQEGKTRHLHRSMLLPLDPIIDPVKECEQKEHLTDCKQGLENSGPTTRSRAKIQTKNLLAANLLMHKYFGAEETPTWTPQEQNKDKSLFKWLKW